MKNKPPKKRRKATSKKKGLLGLPASNTTSGKAIRALAVVAAAGLGSVIGAATPYSFYPGLVAAGVGGWKQMPWLIGLGSTMAFSTSRLEPEATAPVAGIEGLLDETKSRLKSFGKDIAEKSYLNKVIPSLNGTDDVQYFLGSPGNLDMSNFDNSVAQLTQAAAMSGAGTLAGDITVGF